MGEPKLETPFLFVGNQRCLDFINTSLVVNGRPVDLLATFSDLVTWLVQVELLSEEAGKKIERQWGKQGEGAETLEQARAFRDHATGNGRANCRPPASPAGRDGGHQRNVALPVRLPSGDTPQRQI